ncbi:type II secretion system inner membrane protein GspF [Geopsychrobacter electrodiphilus]|uniref:type II secretion system inner membrane protein GspF n=1 Tax=Geopsychrobacter electrodiphilus TaxID=225196 RepID=UPI0003737CC9|nr:type II secretion system inner membrane protein GspF [Geopsychrobacter electrodiphilus]
MALFDYTGLDSSGRKIKGSCDGSGQRAVIAKLRQQNIFVTEIAAAGSKSGGNLLSRWRTPQVPLEELSIATRQLATLLSAGLSLDEAINTVASQIEKQHLAAIFNRVHEAVVEGEPLHLSLAAEGKLFPNIYISMVEVGENSGTLDQALANLADLLEEQARLRNRITAALAYPVLMAVVGTGVLLFLVGFILPKVTRMLIDLDQVLPLPTRMLIAASNLLHDYSWLIFGLLFVILFLVRRWASSDKGRLILAQWRLKLPLIGRLNLLIATSRFSRTLSTLLQGGQSLLRALDITGKLLDNIVLQQAIDRAASQVREGTSLAEPLQKEKLFPAMLIQMIAVGERSGELEQMLRRVADTCDQQIEMSINRLLALLEPIMILFMGGAVGFIVLAILLPIFQASQSLG